MKTKRIILVLSILLMGFVVWVILRKPKIDERTYQSIQNGMTSEQVEALIGGPPGDYGSGEVTGGDFVVQGTEAKKWLGERIGFVIYFSNDDTVAAKLILGVYREESLPERLGNWLDAWLGRSRIVE
jgi:hypothetical protein